MSLPFEAKTYGFRAVPVIQTDAAALNCQMDMIASSGCYGGAGLWGQRPIWPRTTGGEK